MRTLVEVSTTVRKGKRYEEKVKEVYEILRHSTLPLRAMEIGELYSPNRKFWCNEDKAQLVSKPLQTLIKMGVVQRIVREGTPIEIEKEYYGHDEICVDGKRYVDLTSPWRSRKKKVVVTPKISYFVAICPSLDV